jgi:hypothetical protein
MPLPKDLSKSTLHCRTFSSCSPFCDKSKGKWNSNYFNDTWNKANYGPIERQPSWPDKVTNPDHWPAKLAQKEKSVKDKNLLKSYSSFEQSMFAATAAISGLAPTSSATSVSQIEVAIQDVSSNSGKENDKYSRLKFPLMSDSKPAFKFGSDQIASTIRLSREDHRPERKMPSVTKILKETMPVERKLILHAWEERMIAEMGQEGFNQMQHDTLERGKSLHSALESYFLQGSLPKSQDIQDEVTHHHLDSITPILPYFDQGPPLSIESQVIHPQLDYVGYMDALAIYGKTKNKRLVLIDWKTSQKDKLTLRATYDAPLQIAAYVGALNHDRRYPFQVSSALIVVVYNDGRPATAINMSKIQLEKHWIDWLDRYKVYLRMKEFFHKESQ